MKSDTDETTVHKQKPENWSQFVAIMSERGVDETQIKKLECELRQFGYECMDCTYHVEVAKKISDKQVACQVAEVVYGKDIAPVACLIRGLKELRASQQLRVAA